jgi:TolB protein
MPQFPANDSEVDYAAWAQKGIDTVIIGNIEAKGVDQFEISFSLTASL